jgi:hypothetical protein
MSKYLAICRYLDTHWNCSELTLCDVGDGWPLLRAAQIAVVAMLGVQHRQAYLSCLTSFTAARGG